MNNQPFILLATYCDCVTGSIFMVENLKFNINSNYMSTSFKFYIYKLLIQDYKVNF